MASQPRTGHSRPSAQAGGGRRRAVVLGVLGVLGAEVLVFLGLTAALFPSAWAVGNAVFDADQSAGPDRGVNLTEVASHPEPMYGRTVTISGEVDEVGNGQVVVLESEWLFRDYEVLVVAAQPFSDMAGVPVAEERVVRVTGVVRPFQPASLPAGTADDPLVAGYGGAGLLVAESIEVGLAGGPLFPGDPEFGGGSGYDIGYTTYDVQHRTEEILGQTVTVSDEVEEGLLTEHAFTIGDEKLLVVSAAPVDVFVEATAYVTGTVRRFRLAEFEAELGVDLDDARLRAFEGDPVIIAHEIALIA